MTKSILVVDDTPANLRLLVDLLTKQGYRVRTAPNGTLALNSAQKETPDLILLDIMMPEIDGYEVCRQLKNSSPTKEVPVIFISALSEPFDKVSAFKVGGVDYITKPFQVEEVVARVETHLKLAELQRELQKQNQLLTEQNKELQAFASTVAHDLKSPLASIVSALRIVDDLGQASNLDQELREMINISVHGGEKMGRIIDELLLLASVRQEEVELSPVNMSEAVQSVLERLTAMIREYTPQIEVPKNWPVALGYTAWVEEIWANYLSNAIKYGGKPARIELGATVQTEGMIKFWVRDNGKGLTAEQQTKLFTEFSNLQRFQGHGLGLSIVKRIAHKLSGEVGAESTEGQGSTFYFTLKAQ